MSTTVAVTGATGFIGKHIVGNLLSRGFRVRALTRTPQPSTDDNLVWIQGSLEDQASLWELVRGATCVVHCAGQVRGSSQDTFTQCNVNGSVGLMQAARLSGSCKRFLFLSSLAARHPQLSWYARSKFVAERELTSMAVGMSLGIFRPTAVYGPGDKELKPVFDWLLRGVLPRLGSPEAKLSFLHVSDLAEAVSQWLVADVPETQTCELCDGVQGGYNWLRLKAIGSAVRGGPVRLLGVPLPALKFFADVSMLWNRLARTEPMLTHSKIRELTHQDWSASNTSLSETIHWFPEVSLERALRERLF
ncbi:NAD(P)-dependent oxidoreductase [Erwinia sp. QL-Z3]|uniref:NAD-dependent epimerase/dehydratase family protein n=1 Tax=Erwinia sp. QL-Z3 TaxID=2547962 RepID=UPI00107082DB|nr:NAD-dependent epimerase/dehydratase family protein [Erwinia sp. QL-Z3]QBR49024.1 NAD-dependent epimerase/dehydratase family protein [Erwinia sp. QL-Z3]